MREDLLQSEGAAARNVVSFLLRIVLRADEVIE